MTLREAESCGTQYKLELLLPTRTGLKRMNSVSLLAKYKDMLCKVLGSLLFITRYVAITKSLIFAEGKTKKCLKKKTNKQNRDIPFSNQKERFDELQCSASAVS